MQFHWMKICLPCLIHIYENVIVPVKLPTVRMECNGRKYCDCRRCNMSLSVSRRNHPYELKARRLNALVAHRLGSSLFPRVRDVRSIKRLETSRVRDSWHPLFTWSTSTRQTNTLSNNLF